MWRLRETSGDKRNALGTPPVERSPG